MMAPDDPPFFTVYQITHLESGKVYVGKHKTTDLEDGYMGSGKMLKRALTKHGLDAFSKEILHVLDSEEAMDAKEAEIVTEEFCARDDTYNLCPGGKGGWGYVNQNYPQELRKTAGRLGGLVPPPKSDRLRLAERMAKMNKEREDGGFTGKTHAKATRKAIGEANSKAQSGERNSQHGTVWITDGISARKIKKSDPIPEGWRKGRK